MQQVQRDYNEIIKIKGSSYAKNFEIISARTKYHMTLSKNVMKSNIISINYSQLFHHIGTLAE